MIQKIISLYEAGELIYPVSKDDNACEAAIKDLSSAITIQQSTLCLSLAVAYLDGKKLPAEAVEHLSYLMSRLGWKGKDTSVRFNLGDSDGKKGRPPGSEPTDPPIHN